MWDAFIAVVFRPVFLAVLLVVSAFGASTRAIAHGAVAPDWDVGALKLQGFHCLPFSPMTGVTCIGSIPEYPRQVAVIVPVAYHPRSQAELILHLHGYNLPGHPLSYMVDRFAYASALAASGRDAILVAPSSFGECADYKASLVQNPGQFEGFIDRIMHLLLKARLVSSPVPASIALTGHSGAFGPLASLVADGVRGAGVFADLVHELDLLDASYARATQFAQFARDPRHRFWSVYHRTDPQMKAVNPQIMAILKQAGVSYYEAPGPKVPAEVVQLHRVGFVVSDVDHEKTSAKYFSMLLKKVREAQIPGLLKSRLLQLKDPIYPDP